LAVAGGSATGTTTPLDGAEGASAAGIACELQKPKAVPSTPIAAVNRMTGATLRTVGGWCGEVVATTISAFESTGPDVGACSFGKSTGGGSAGNLLR
jgi:hypothetical protein